MAANVIQNYPAPDASTPDRAEIQGLMQRAGLLVEPSPSTLTSAAQSTLTLEEAAAILSRGEAAPFSEQLEEERGPRD
ncbi:MAG TPA: hypothetical protein VLA19_23500 [Herpetosiphonaceae bacterium]|nr:hypothetical protein [Herpetosiphonaceae bacterium]